MLRVFSLLALVSTLAPALAQPVPLPGFTSRVIGETAVYAASPAALDSIAPAVGAAQATFLDAFGEAPPPLALVVAPDAHHLAGLDLAPLHATGVAVRTTLETARPFALFGRALIGSAASGLRVFALMDSTGAFQSDDRLLRIGGQAVPTPEALGRAMDAIPEGEPVQVVVRRDGAEVALALERPAYHLAGIRGGRFGMVGEIAVAYLDAAAARTCGGCLAPSWLRSAVRGLAASPQEQDDLARFVEASPGLRLSFDAMTIDPPISATSSLTSPDRNRAEPTGARVGASVTRATPDQREQMQRVRSFNAQALSVARWLRATRGADGLRAHIDPATDAELDEAAWSAWIDAKSESGS